MLAPLHVELRSFLMNERIDYATHILIGIKKSGHDGYGKMAWCSAAGGCGR